MKESTFFDIICKTHTHTHFPLQSDIIRAYDTTQDKPEGL